MAEDWRLLYDKIVWALSLVFSWSMFDNTKHSRGNCYKPSIFGCESQHIQNKQTWCERHIMNSLLTSLARAVLGNIGLQPFLFCRDLGVVRPPAPLVKIYQCQFISEKKQDDPAKHNRCSLAEIGKSYPLWEPDCRYFLSVEKFFLDGTKVRSTTIVNFTVKKSYKYLHSGNDRVEWQVKLQSVTRWSKIVTVLLKILPLNDF